MIKDEKTLSDETAAAGTNINIVLPDWRTAINPTTQPSVDLAAQKRKNQLYIGVCILVVLIIAVIAIRKPKTA